MNSIEIIKRRRSCRKFIDKAIPKEILEDLLECAVSAPSGFNSQNFRFLLVSDKGEIQKLGAIKRPPALTKSASAWIMVFCDNKAHSGFSSFGC